MFTYHTAFTHQASHTAAPRRFSQGFTLIETALALLAIGLGLLALMGLGHFGLQNSHATLNQQRSDLLAQAIGETLKAYNTYYIEAAQTNEEGRTWWHYWEDTRNNHSNYRIPFPPVAHVSVPGDPALLKFLELERCYDPENFSLTDWHPRYGIVINPRLNSEQQFPEAAIHVEIEIWPDGETASSDTRRYAFTLNNSGGLL